MIGVAVERPWDDGHAEPGEGQGGDKVDSRFIFVFHRSLGGRTCTLLDLFDATLNPCRCERTR